MGLEIEELLSKVSRTRDFVILICDLFGYVLFSVLFIPLFNVIILYE